MQSERGKTSIGGISIVQLVYIFLFIFVGLSSLYIAPIISLSLPYFKNFPYSYLIYGFSFLVITILTIRFTKQKKIKIFGLENPSLKSLLLMFPICILWFSTGTSFIRFFFEHEQSYEFNRGVIVQKYISSNHNYKSLSIAADSHIINLEGYDEITWNKFEVNDIVSKKMGSKILTKLTKK